jgi:DNA polymerase III psi subunit
MLFCESCTKAGNFITLNVEHVISVRYINFYNYWKASKNISQSLVILFFSGQSQALTSRNCVLMDIHHNCTYKDLLWLKQQLAQFEKKFNSDFLIENGILR